MDIINDLMDQTTNNPENERIKIIEQKAIEVGRLSKSLNDWIEAMKIDLIVMLDECDETKAKERVSSPFRIKHKGNYGKSNYFFGTDRPPGDAGRVHELKIKIEEYRKKLLSFVVTVEDKEQMEKKLSALYLDVPEDNQGMWEMFNFYDLPLAAALAELTHWQNLVRNAENELLNYFLDQADDMKKE